MDDHSFLDLLVEITAPDGKTIRIEGAHNPVLHPDADLLTGLQLMARHATGKLLRGEFD